MFINMCLNKLILKKIFVNEYSGLANKTIKMYVNKNSLKKLQHSIEK